jgi:hypothetical protein
MRKWARVLAAGAGALLAAAQAPPPEDGKAAFERREDKMKHMGRPFYLGIGRVVKGTAAYGESGANLTFSSWSVSALRRDVTAAAPAAH